MIIIFFEIILVAYSFVNFYTMIKNYKRFYCIYPIIAVFDLVMVVPILLEIFWGIPDIPRDVYMNFVNAMNDTETSYIYCLFILLAQIIFSCELGRIKRIDKTVAKSSDLRDFLLAIQNLKHKKILKYLCYIISFTSFAVIIFSPAPMYYLTFRNVHMMIPTQILEYSKDVVTPVFEMLVVAIIIMKLLSTKNNIWSSIFRLFLIVFFTIVNGKRTYLMIIVGVFFLIDLLREGSLKKIAPKYIVLFGFVALYFYAYMYITDKISYNDDWYYELNEYIFRSMHARFSIYAALHPNEIHILDYPGQSMLFNLLFFVPRDIWTNKPFPYIDYYMRGLLNLSSLRNVPYHMPASYYPEFVSNFGLLGLIISLMFTVWITRFFDKRKMFCKLLGAALIALLNIYYYNDLLKIVAVFIAVLCIKERYRFVIRKNY